MSGDFEGLSKPAQRALANAGIKSLKTLAARSEKDIAALHGMGPTGIALLRAKLKASGKSFKKG